MHLGSPVSAIAQDDEGVVVTTVAPAGPRTVRASCLVFAAPPSATARVAFSPALPLARQQLADRCYVGSIVKCIIVYRTAFWREAGMSGEVIGDGSGGPIFQVFDDCLPLLAAAAAGTEHAAGTSASHLPALVAFLNGDMGRSGASMPAPKRQQAVLQQLARWFGAQALEPVQFLEKDWCSDPWTQGCPIGIWPPVRTFTLPAACAPCTSTLTLCAGRVCCGSMGTRCGCRAGVFTGPPQRPRLQRRGSWMARCRRASGRRQRCCSD